MNTRLTTYQQILQIYSCKIRIGFCHYFVSTSSYRPALPKKREKRQNLWRGEKVLFEKREARTTRRGREGKSKNVKRERTKSINVEWKLQLIVKDVSNGARRHSRRSHGSCSWPAASRHSINLSCSKKSPCNGRETRLTDWKGVKLCIHKPIGSFMAPRIYSIKWEGVVVVWCCD